MMEHTDAVAAVQLELSRLGCMTARHYVGLIYDRKGNRRTIGTKGHADMSGVAPGGRAIAVEVKVGSDRPKPKQREWADAWQGRGGLYAVSRPDRDGWREQLSLLLA